MKKTLFVMLALAIAFTCGAAKAAKKTEAPVPAAAAAPVAPAVQKEAVKPGIIVNGFEEDKLSPAVKGMTFLSSGEGQEQTVDDVLSLEVNKDAKFVKSGKQSLKVDFKMKPVSDSKFANISFSSKTPMGNNTSFVFWVNKVKGKSSLTVTLFDSNWKKGVSQAIPLVDGAKTISLSAADFTTGFNWAGVTTIQLALRGDTVMYIDDIKFSGASK